MVLRAAQRALLQARDESELLTRICEIAVDEAGYRLAWAGFAEDDPERTVRPVARAGFEAGYLGAISVSWGDGPLGRGPSGTAIRTGRPAVGGSFLTDPDLAPWREEALLRGFASALALPLRADDHTFGVLVIYAATPDAFSAWDVELLAGLADDLAFGISTLRARAAAQEELRRSERNLAEAQRIAHIGSWEWDLRTGVAKRSEEAHRIFGVEPGAFEGTNQAFLARVHPDDRDRVQAAEEVAIRGGSEYSYEVRIIRPDGSVRLAREKAEVIRDEHGTPVRVVGTVEDITERVAAEEDRARLLAALEQTADAVWMQDLDGIVRYVNRSFTRVYGYKPEDIVGTYAGIVHSGRHEHAFFDAIWASVAAGKTWTGLIVNRRRDGTLVELEAVISGIRNAAGQLVSYMQTDRDVTRERELESELEHSARERETIEAALKRIDPGSTPEAIAADACAEMVGLPHVDSAFVIALDDEQHGSVLAVEGRLAAALPPSRMIPPARAQYLLERASVGVWTEAWRSRAADGTYGEDVAATGLKTVAYAPLRGHGGVIGVVGLGIHDRPDPAFVDQLPVLTTLASILGTLLSPGLEARHREDDVRARIQGVLDAAAFAPFFQPIIEFHSGTIVGYESLSRFADGLPPDATFALAARCGLGLELEVATLRAALEASTILPAGAYLSVNASPALIGSGALRELVREQVRRIVLEITEHVVIEDYPALRHELATLGPTVRVAVDDAGAGYASLRHVLELAPAFVKLDIGLIRGINADPARQALVAGMGYFAVKRKIRLIAEGIETPAELKALRELGIGYGQGYLLGRPQDSRGPGSWPGRIAIPGIGAAPRIGGKR